MNKQVITEKEILDVSKKFIINNGFEAFNIRAIAKECEVSIGTIYNYFPSKLELIVSTVRSVWQEIFSPFDTLMKQKSFLEAVKFIYKIIDEGNLKYPEFFLVHSLLFASKGKQAGIDAMNSYFDDLKLMLLDILKNDSNVNQAIFKDFSMTKYVDYIFRLILSTLLNKEDVDPLYNFIELYIYR